MPSVTFWNLNGLPSLSIQKSSLTYASSNDTIHAAALFSNASIELLRNGSVIASGTGSVSYTINSNASSTWAAGKYNVTAYEPGAGVPSTTKNITISKATPKLNESVSNAIKFSMSTIDNYSIKYSVNSFGNQLEAYISMNGINVSSTNSISTYTFNMSNTSSFYAFTPGNANYTPVYLNKTSVYVVKYPYYIPITIYNNQSSNTPAPFQQLININMSKYADYANGNLSNIFFFYGNKTIIPSWRESGTAGAYFNGGPAYLMQNKGYTWMNNAAQHFTISIWVNPHSPNGVILDELNQSDGWHDSWLDLVNGNVYMKIWNLGCVNLGAIPDNQWSNIVMEYNGSTYSGYINGKFAGSGTGTRSVPGGSYALSYALGKNDTTNCGSGSAFDGLMLNYQIYNTTLQPSGIASIYSSGRYGTPPFNASEGLSGWWQLKYNSSAQEGGDNMVYSNVNFTSLNTYYWLKLNNGIPANSNLTVYMGFANKSDMLFNKLTTGEAPQLSPKYAEYDDGANVFPIYFNGNTNPSDFSTGGGDTVTQITGITMPNGNIGNALRFTTGSSETATTVDIFTGSNLVNAPNYYITEASFQSDGSGTDMDWGFVQNSGAGASNNAIFVGTQFGSAYFDQAYISNGARTTDINGQGTTTTSWRYSSLTYGSPTSFFGYIAPQLYSTSGGYSGTVTTNPIASVSPIYWGWYGDVGASGKWVQFNYVRVRAYPPNGVMPTYNIGSIYAPGAPELTINKSNISYGQQDEITASSQISGDQVELSINGNVVSGPTSNTINYEFPISSPGTYIVNATNINNSKTTSMDINVIKATPAIRGPAPGFYSNSYNSTYSISTVSNQLTGYLYINGVKVSATNSSNSIRLNASGAYALVFNTTGNANYTPATTGTINVDILNQSIPYRIPNYIYRYSMVRIHNSQSVPTIKRPQEYLQINISAFANYISYNYTSADFEFFSSNGTIVPAWIIDNVSGEIGIWLKLPKSIPAGSNETVYLGFASKTTNLLSSSGTSGIGEAPQLSPSYAEYDDGASVFQAYFNGVTPLSDFSVQSGYSSAQASGQCSTSLNCRSSTVYYIKSSGSGARAFDVAYNKAFPDNATLVIGSNIDTTLTNEGFVALGAASMSSSPPGIDYSPGNGDSLSTTWLQNGNFGGSSTSTSSNPPPYLYYEMNYVPGAPDVVSTIYDEGASVSYNNYIPSSYSGGLYIGIASATEYVNELDYSSWMAAAQSTSTGVFPTANVTRNPQQVGSIELFINGLRENTTLNYSTINITATSLSGIYSSNTVEALLNGNVLCTGTGTCTYRGPVAVSASTYNVTAKNTNTSAKQTFGLKVTKAPPEISISAPYYGINNGTIYYSSNTINSQVKAYLYVNVVQVSNTLSKSSYTVNTIGNYSTYASTPGNSNYTNFTTSTKTVRIIPKPKFFVPIIINNTQSTATPAPFQQELTFNSLTYRYAEAGNLDNVLFFYANGTIVPSWLESGNSNTSTSTIYWLNISKGIPAKSSITVYIGMMAQNESVFNNISTGEAAQLSSSYGEFDDIAHVMDKGLLYQIWGWGGSGIQPQHELYQSSMTPGSSFTFGSTTATASPTLYNANFTGVTEDVDGSSKPYVIINYQNGYSGGAPPPNPPVSNDNFWLLKAIGFVHYSSGISLYGISDDAIGLGYSQYTTGSAESWLGGTNNPNNTINEWKAEGATTYSGTIPSSGDYPIELDFENQNGPGYIGMWSSSPLDYYSAAYPPNGVMPSANVEAINGPPALNITYKTIAYSNTTDYIYATARPSNDTVEILINGNVVDTGIGTLNYTLPILPAGTYNIEAHDVNKNLSTNSTITIVKAVPEITQTSGGTYSNNYTIGFGSNTINDQLTINLYVDNSIVASTNSISDYSIDRVGNYTFFAGTAGNANYTARNLTVQQLHVIPKQVPSVVPNDIAYYVPIVIANNQPVATPAPFQEMLTVDSALYSQYENGSLENVKFFYSNGTTVPSWLYSGNSNHSTSSVYWVKLSGGIAADSYQTIFMGFSTMEAVVMNNRTTGEAPQLSKAYGQYDDIAGVMNPGLLYEVYYNGATTGCVPTDSDVYAAGVYSGYSINGSCSPITSSTLPSLTLLTGTSQAVDGSGENNVLINVQGGYTSGAPFPNPPVSNYSKIIVTKSIGFVDSRYPINFYVKIDDAGQLGYSNYTLNGSEDNWLGSYSNTYNIINEWKAEGATQYNGIATGTGAYRIQYDYANQGGPGYWSLWSNSSVSYYSPSAQPNGVMPAYTTGQLGYGMNRLIIANNPAQYHVKSGIIAVGRNLTNSLDIYVNGSLVKNGTGIVNYTEDDLPLGNFSVKSVNLNTSNTITENLRIIPNDPFLIIQFPQSLYGDQNNITGISNVTGDRIELRLEDGVILATASNTVVYGGNVLKPGKYNITAIDLNQPAYSQTKSLTILPPNVTLSIQHQTSLYHTNDLINATTSQPLDHVTIAINGTVVANSTAKTSYTENSLPLGVYPVQACDADSLTCTNVENLTIAPNDPHISIQNRLAEFGQNDTITATSNVTGDNVSILINGKVVASGKGTAQFNTASLVPGIYNATAEDTIQPAYSQPLQFEVAGQVVSPAGILNYVPILITNNQSIATKAPFQQMIEVNAQSYASYESGGMQNVEFSYANGTIIPSWFEGSLANESKTTSLNESTNDVYWLKIANGIPAKSSITVYMDFAEVSKNLLNSNITGEAPQLSPTYAQYDNGANIFNNYWNFAGTSMPGGFTEYSNGGTTSVDNSLNIDLASSGDYLSFIYNTPISANDTIVETYDSGTRGNGPTDLGMYQSNGGSAGGYAGVADTWGWGYGTISSGYNNIGRPFDVSNGNGVASIYWIGGGNEGVGWNYDFVSSTNTNEAFHSSAYMTIGIGYAAPGSDINYYWLRTRYYPPNGVMPSVDFGSERSTTGAYLNIQRNPSLYRTNDTFTAIASNATYIIEILKDGTLISRGTGSTSYTENDFAIGTYNITADNLNTGNTTTLKLSVIPNPPRLSISRAKLLFGQEDTISAYSNVTGDKIAIEVSNSIVSEGVNNATYAETNLSIGNHTVVAEDLNSSNIAQSAPQVITVLKNPPKLEIEFANSPYGKDDNITAISNVTGNRVQILVNNAIVANATGTAVYNANTLTVGTYNITARDISPNDTSQTSNTLTITPPNIELYFTSNPGLYGNREEITAEASISVDNVTLSINGNVVASGVGKANLTESNFSVGNYTVQGCDTTAKFCTANTTLRIKPNPPLLTIQHNPMLYDVDNNITAKANNTGSAIKLLINGTVVENGTNEVFYNAKSLALGTYNITAESLSDNVLAVTTEKLTVNKNLPILSIQNRTPLYRNTNLISVLANVTGYPVELLINGTEVAHGIGNITYDADTLKPGNYSVIAADTNSSNPSTVNSTIKVLAPKVSIIPVKGSPEYGVNFTLEANTTQKLDTVNMSISNTLIGSAVSHLYYTEDNLSIGSYNVTACDVNASVCAKYLLTISKNYPSLKLSQNPSPYGTPNYAYVNTSLLGKVVTLSINGNVVAHSPNSLVYNLTNLTTGTYSLLAQVNDSADENATASASLSVTTPQAYIKISNDPELFNQTGYINATASLKTAPVALYINGTEVANSTGSVSYSEARLKIGSYSIKACDTYSGACSYSSLVVIPNPPGLSAQYYKPLYDQNDTVVAVTNISRFGIQVKLDGNVIANNTKFYSFNTKGFAPGIYNVTATELDANDSYAESTAFITVEKPAISISFTRNTTYYSATDVINATTSQPSDSIALYIDGNVVSKSKAHVSYSESSFAIGSYNVTACDVNASSCASANLAVVPNPPILAIKKSPELYSANDTITATANVTGNRVQILVNNAIVANATGTAVYNANVLSTGTYNITARDISPNDTSQTSRQLDVIPNPPLLTIQHNPDVYSRNDTISARSNLTLNRVSLFINGKAVVSNAINATYNANDLAVGTYNITAEDVNASNIAYSTEYLSIVPNPPLLTIQHNPALYGVNDSIKLESNITGNPVALYINGTEVANAIDNLTYIENSLAIGNYIITVKDTSPENPASFNTTLHILPNDPLLKIQGNPAMPGQNDTISAIANKSGDSVELLINGTEVASGIGTVNYDTNRLAVGYYSIVAVDTVQPAYSKKIVFAVANTPIAPTNITSLIPILITNNQSRATPSTFQQLLHINSSAYSTAEKANLSNVEFFYGNGTVIPSWIEQNATSSSKQTAYWIKLLSSIPAKGRQIVYMGFSNSNIFSQHISGEAPQLSSTYAQYDNGQNVFNYYTDFAGTSDNTSQYTINGIATIDNGLILPPSNKTSYVSSVKEYGTATNESDIYWDATTPLKNAITLGYNASHAVTVVNALFWAVNKDNDRLFTAKSIFNNFENGLNLSGNYVFSNYNIGNRSYGSYSKLAQEQNYTSYNTSTYAFDNKAFLQVENNPNNRTTGVSVDVYWMRTRSTPPNGVMPFASYGLLHAHSIGSCNITASTSKISLGTLFANTSEATKAPITLTNHGNSTAYIYTYGSKWVSKLHYFGPTNTTYANLTGVPWALAGKIFDIQRNWIVSIAPGSTATVYIGADIPNATYEGNYSQSIYFVSDCA